MTVAAMTVAAMTAPSRAEINRRNAQRSTGPRSIAGKQRVRFNALKHGIRARTAVLPGEEDAFHARLDAWTIDLRPRDEVERFLVTRAVEVSCQLDRAGRAREVRRAAARHAGAGRLAGQAEEVVALGRRLFWDPVGPLCLYPHAVPADGELRRVSGSGDPEDPDDPARIVVRLEAMILGCAWLLDRWGELRTILEDGLLWQPPDRLKAIRMLGRQPLEAIDDRRVMAVYLSCWAVNPAERNGFDDLINDLAPKERAVYLDRLNGRDPMAGMPESPEAARAELLALIAGEEERLEAVLAGHLEREEAEAAAEQAFDESAWGERLRRYEMTNDRALLRIIETLRQRHRETDGANSPAGPASPPAQLPPPETEVAGELPEARPITAEPAGSPPPETEAGDAREADELTEAEVPARMARIARAQGRSPETPAGSVSNEAASSDGARGSHDPDRRSAGPDSAGTDAGPAQDVVRGSAARTRVATVGIEVPPSIDRNLPDPTNVTSRPVAPAHLLAGAVLALFALLFLAGRSVASDGVREDRAGSLAGRSAPRISRTLSRVHAVPAEESGAEFRERRPSGSGQASTTG